MKLTLPIERVTAMFSVISGELADGYYDFCEVAARSLLNGTKPEKYCESRESEFIYAAACLANYRLVLSRCSEGIEVYKAGDMNIGNDLRSALDAARALLDDALKPISSFLISDSFSFRAI